MLNQFACPVCKSQAYVGLGCPVCSANKQAARLEQRGCGCCHVSLTESPAEDGWYGFWSDQKQVLIDAGDTTTDPPVYCSACWAEAERQDENGDDSLMERFIASTPDASPALSGQSLF